jgi:hypothetical protein
MNAQQIYRGNRDAGMAPVSGWKLIISWVVLTTLGWALIFTLLIAVFWVLG